MASAVQVSAWDRANRGTTWPDYRPEGDAFEDEIEARRSIDGWNAIWSYGSDWAPGCEVLRYDRPDGVKEYRVISIYEGRFYVSLPPLPYELYNRSELPYSETIYVCEGEKTADAAIQLGLTATTSLCGPKKASLSDWSPLEDKQVVILRDFDDDGLRYARDVAQLVLAAGARSAKIVTLPGLNESEDLVEWIGDRHGLKASAAMRAEIESLVATAPFVERCLEDGTVTELHRLSDVISETRKWVLDGVIPQGAVTLITGEAGIGKSRLTLGLAARVTRVSRHRSNDLESDDRQIPGLAIPDTGCELSTKVPGFHGSGAVVVFSAADGLARTIRPTLEAARADLTRIFAVRGVPSMGDVTEAGDRQVFQFDRDLTCLDVMLRRLNHGGHDVCMVVIDPISSYLGSVRTRSESDAIASRLSELAERSGVAIVLVCDSVSCAAGRRSSRKLENRDALRAVNDVARSVWSVVRDAKDPSRRCLVPVKTNFCESPPSLTFSIRDGDLDLAFRATPTLDDGDSLDDGFFHLSGQTELSRATEWLRTKLTAGPVRSEDLKEEAGEMAISKSTLRRAYHHLGVLATREEGSKTWYWHQPGDHLPKLETASHVNREPVVIELLANHDR